MAAGVGFPLMRLIICQIFSRLYTPDLVSNHSISIVLSKSQYIKINHLRDNGSLFNV